MPFAIFGDIHANLEALEAVLADATAQGCERFICLGDIVGYNADPKVCLERVRALNCPVIQGNHDQYVSSESSLSGFNVLAEAALRWTREQLSPSERRWLGELPLVEQIEGFTVVHSTLDDPSSWGYVLNQLDAAASFSRQRTQLCFFGHTHAPRLYVRDTSVTGSSLDFVRITGNKQYFINVGSVGQPRDGDWRAAYVIFDLESREVELRRVEYEIEQTQEKILEAGLPVKLAERLLYGR